MPGGIQHNLGWVAPRESPSLNILSSGGDNNAHAVSDPSAILAKGQQPLRDDLTDQPRLVFIGRPFAVPFIFVPFHNGRDTRA